MDAVDNNSRTGYHSSIPGEGVIMSVGELLTVQEISNFLKVPKNYVYYLTHTKRIPFIKIGGHLRFRQSDIDEWLRSMEVQDVGIQERE